jgi:SAM-dependent methyltransferase
MDRLWTTPPRPLDQRRADWKAFAPDLARDEAAIVRRHVGTVDRVVDAGCGAGQEMLPYIGDAVCIGVDRSMATLGLARQLLRDCRPDARIVLLCAGVEDLPLRAGWADLVISKLVLQISDVRSVLTETSRVLRPGGGAIVVFHHPRYYLRKLETGLRAHDLRPMVYALRVLLTGLSFHLSGTQRPVLGMPHTYLTVARLRRMAHAVGLELIAELPDGSAEAPKLLLQRR